MPEKQANPSKDGDAKPEGSKAAKAAMTAGCKHQRRRCLTSSALYLAEGGVRREKELDKPIRGAIH